MHTYVCSIVLKSLLNIAVYTRTEDLFRYVNVHFFIVYGQVYSYITIVINMCIAVCEEPEFVGKICLVKCI